MAAQSQVIRIGAVFPLHGVMTPLAREEYRGVVIAQQFVNAAGGVDGRRIALVVKELDRPEQSGRVMRSLHRQRIDTVLGAYSSALSIPASAAAAHAGMVYWEAGAVADRLTGRGLSTVFRVGASGSDLGINSAHFAAMHLAPLLHKSVRALRVSVVWGDDAYATSVADAALSQAHSLGMQLVSQNRYDIYEPDWAPIMRTIKRAHPDILILASHIPDGVAFRRAMLAAHIHVGAFIGSTMAQCEADFGAVLGRDAIGVFASDRPPGGFDPSALNVTSRRLYNRLASAWHRETGQRQPSEEGLSGFAAAWALFHYVLPHAARIGTLTPKGISRAARAMKLPEGALPNGAGLQFATDPAHLGQNLRAAAVIWQWQGVRHSVVVWPPVYATGKIKFVPLP